MPGGTPFDLIREAFNSVPFNDFLAVGHNEDGSNIVGMPPQYVLSSDGATVTARDATSGGIVGSGADVGAVLAAVMPAANSAGATITFRNDGNAFPCSTAALLPRGITGKLKIDGNGVTVVMAAAGQQFLGIDRTADYQTFQHIEIRGFTVDCAALVNTAGLLSIIGSKVAGLDAQRANYLDWLFEDIYFTNVQVASTANAIFGISLNTAQLGTGEGTQTSVKRIRANRIEMDGGNALFTATGLFTGALATGLNTLCDEIYVENWRHDLGTVAAGLFAATHIQIGGRGRSGHVYVGAGYGRGSGDVGVEIDCPREAVVENVVIEDSFNAGYYLINYTNPANSSENRCTFRNCLHRKTASTSATCIAFNPKVNSTVNIPGGDVAIEHCAAYQHTAENATTTGWGIFCGDTATAGFSSVTVDGFLAVSDAMAVTANVTSNPLAFQSRTTTCRLTLRNVTVKVAGTVTAATLTWRGVTVGNGVFLLAFDRITIDNQLTGNAANVMDAIDVALSGSATTADGWMQRLRLSAADTTVVGVRLRGTGFLTIPAKKQILVSDSDLSGAKAANEVVLQADTAKQTAVFHRNLVYNTASGQPAPTTLTGLVTATGAALATGWASLVVFAQGSGSGITAIDVSTDGGTTYKNIVTQAAGALPAGNSAVVGPLRSDALVRVTFTTTQPTVTLVPANP